MSQNLVKHLEDNSMSILNDAIVDVRANSGATLHTVSDADLQVALYTVVLKIIDLLRSNQNMPETLSFNDTREVWLRNAKEMMSFIDGQSSYTTGHTEAVARHVVQIGSRLGLSDPEIEDLEYVAWIHNLGLINQSQKLATVDRRLSQDELKQARNHTVVGAEIIRPIEFLAHLVPTVRYHHHRFGGTPGESRGEPRGEDLPLGARIIAVADAYQAMIEARAYRPAFTRQEALNEIVKGQGTQFDPQLVPLAHELM